MYITQSWVGHKSGIQKKNKKKSLRLLLGKQVHLSGFEQAVEVGV
jgi:hypothetical protein